MELSAAAPGAVAPQLLHSSTVSTRLPRTDPGPWLQPAKLHQTPPQQQTEGTRARCTRTRLQLHVGPGAGVRFLSPPVRVPHPWCVHGRSFPTPLQPGGRPTRARSGMNGSAGCLGSADTSSLELPGGSSKAAARPRRRARKRGKQATATTWTNRDSLPVTSPPAGVQSSRCTEHDREPCVEEKKQQQKYSRTRWRISSRLESQSRA